MSATLQDQLKHFCQQHGLTEEELAQEIAEEIGKINTQDTIQHYDNQIKVLEELIDEFGINRSLGNILTNVKAKKSYWEERK